MPLTVDRGEAIMDSFGGNVAGMIYAALPEILLVCAVLIGIGYALAKFYEHVGGGGWTTYDEHGLEMHGGMYYRGNKYMKP